MKKNTLIKIIFIIIIIGSLIYAFYPQTIYSKTDYLDGQNFDELQIEIIKKDSAFGDGVVAEVSGDELQHFVDIFKEYKVICSFWNNNKDYKNEIYIIKFKNNNEELGVVSIGEKYVSSGYARYLPVDKIDLSFFRSFFE